jgi:hypothetical protein
MVRGHLVFWSLKNWLVLLNDLDDPLVGRSVEKGETIHVGSLVWFNTHTAKVQSFFFSPGLQRNLLLSGRMLCALPLLRVIDLLNVRLFFS